MNYKIVIASSTVELSNKVNKEFKTGGWAPKGGLSVLRGGLGDNTYYQAMVKEDK